MLRTVLPSVLSLLLLATHAGAQVAGSLYQGLAWRMIGPHRGGRTKAVAGVPGHPSRYYVGVVNGGIWKTTDYGRTWSPIFDDQPTGSIGAIAVAPSNPEVIYAGSGEGLQRPDLSTGDGIYKSTNGGRSWEHLGLRDAQQVTQLVVDPRNPDRVFVAVLGHPFGPNSERGVFRSSDGARTWEKVLYVDENTGAADLVMDPRDPNTLYAALWESRQAPWENGAFSGPGSGVYKSTDGGTSWHPLKAGLPTFADDGLGRIGLAIAPSDPRRLYATVEASRKGGLYRSDDAGEHWYLANGDSRYTNRASDFAEVKVHPHDADIVFTGSVVTWKSTDGGRTFSAFRGAPGGDDYHRVFINPDNPEVMVLASDQGAIITVNGGQTWSSWYNQPTAQFYHVIADNDFPYRVCGAQQESGSVCIRSRSDEGQITFRDWTTVGVEEYGYIAPDPLNPDIVYGGRVSRWDRRTRQVQNVAPVLFRTPDYRVLRTAPVVFSPVDRRTLYFASNTVWKTTTGGRSWTQVSPDLTRRDSTVPPNVGKYRESASARARHPGVVYALAPSPVAAGTIWAGTDDGLIHVTRDGGRSWRDVTPPDLRSRPWAKVSIIDASHFDAGTAYAAINTLRLDDLRPFIYRTRDGGATWQRITSGIPDGAPVNVVREDPVRRGLLYAGTERDVWFSVDDGAHWQSLRLNMPATSIRDLWVKDDDLIAGTHGRSFWILDDVSPLRQVDASTASRTTILFRPQVATRWRWNTNTDTPLPQEEPAGQNPPDGAIIDVYVGASMPRETAMLEIIDSSGALVRRYASSDTAMPPADIGNTPAYWIRPTTVFKPAPGRMTRFVWDLHWSAPSTGQGTYPISAIYRDTPREPRGPIAVPGRYTVRFTYGARVLTQALRIRMDPRVKTPARDLERQLVLSRQIAAGMSATHEASAEARRLRAGIRVARERSTPELALALDSLDVLLAASDSGASTGSLARLHADLRQLYGVIQGADVAPASQVSAAAAGRLAMLDVALREWARLERSALALDARLRAAGIPSLRPGR